jgi:hypothetical protein
MSAIDQQIINVTRTYAGAYLQTTKFLGLKFDIIPHTTLNEKFGIQNNVKPAVGVSPYVRYLVIGNMGHYTVRADDGSDETVNRRHRTNHMGLYNHIPWALRELTNDFDASRRQNFHLRRIEVHQGVQYFAYYARGMDVATVVPQLLEIEIIDNQVVTRPYVPTADDLNPIPPVISNNGTVVGSNKTISASAIVTVKLSAEEIKEITEAHRIRTGSMNSPVISEIGLCSGVTVSVEGQSGTAGAFMYDEVIACQINVHIATNHPVGYNSKGLTLSFDVGGVEPTLGTTALNVAQFA